MDMGYRKNPLATDEYFHIYNRGVEKRLITIDNHDRERWIKTMFYYRFANASSQFAVVNLQNFAGERPLVELVAYCLMPNHFHLLAKQIQEGGISLWVRKMTVSYSRYFNTRHNRVGPLFQGPYKNRRIASTEDLLHISRYIHLNPFVARLTENPAKYQWSSFNAYLEPRAKNGLQQQILLQQFSSPILYERFVTDFADYARSYHELQHLFLDG